jgi:hypothetical protein
MSYRHRGGPLDGLIDQTCDPDYDAVAAPMHRWGFHPTIQQDAIWREARVTSAIIRHRGRTYKADVGEEIRTMQDENGNPSIRRGPQTVRAIGAMGLIFFDGEGDWEPIAQVHDMDVLDFIEP